MPIIITPATTGDIDALVVLLAELFAIEQDFTEDATTQRRGLELLLACPERAVVFVARDPVAGVVGMVSAQLVLSTAIGAPSAWIEDMVVRESFRGQGVGRALLDHATAWSATQGAGRVQLLADADNTPALAYYRRLGWQPTRLLAWKRSVGDG
jgi:GNAT superfamily N-acetyltransferase